MLYDSQEVFVCFKCSQFVEDDEVDTPIETETLSMCPCYEGHFVGSVQQLCDYLNDAYSQLEEIGLLEKALTEATDDLDEDMDYE